MRGCSASIRPATWRALSRRSRQAGYHGVMNCPTVALIDGKFRSDLEETGMGFAREVDVLGQASRMGLFTKAFCTSPDEALAMAEAGVDNIIIHFGNSSGGTIGSKTVMADDAALRARGLDPRCARGEILGPHLHLPWGRDRDAGRLRALSEERAAAAWLCRRLVGRALSDREIGGGGDPRVPRRQAAEGPLGGGQSVSRRPRHARQQARRHPLRLRRASQRPAPRLGWSIFRCGRTRMVSPMSRRARSRRQPERPGTRWPSSPARMQRRR